MANRNSPYPPSGAPKGQQEPQKVKVEYALGTDLTCDNCKNYTFHEVVFIKHYSALVSPIGKPIHVPTATMACDHCGHVNDIFVPAGYFNKKEAAPGATVSTPETKTETNIIKSSLDIVR